MKNLMVITLTSLLFLSASAMDTKKNKEKKVELNDGFEITYGYSARQGMRPDMEDTHIIIPNFEGKGSLFAMFDGHAGKQVATIAAQAFPLYFSNELLKNSNGSRGQLLENAFARLEEIIINKKVPSGAAALVAFLEKNNLRLAWIGDVRALVIHNAKVIAATRDHKLDVPAEKARIERVGGKIYLDGVPRINGLAMARSLGDIEVKNMTPGAVSAKPEIERVQIKDGDILIIACDGLWDIFNNQEVAARVSALLRSDVNVLKNIYPNKKYGHEIIEEEGDEYLKLIARALRDVAYNNQSADNISVMVVQFKKPKASVVP